DQIRVGSRVYDLSQDADLDAYVGTFSLAKTQADAAVKALKQISSGLRDEFGKLVGFWARGERVNHLPGRMLFSGEHAGSMFWGKHNDGFVGLDEIRGLAQAFPMAAAAIEDLHVSACNSANEIHDWPTIFPKVRTIWAYRSTCPSPATGALY